MTVAQLKRDAKDGKISLELLEVGMWRDGIPERIKGIRKCCGANTVAIFVNRNDGKGKSELSLPKASLVEYTDDTLTIYLPGLREANAEEQRCFDEWKKVEQTERYQKNLEYDILTDYNQCYYEKKRFFSDRHMEYLLGFEKEHGLKWDWNEKKVRDDSVKGEIQLQYRVHR